MALGYALLVLAVEGGTALGLVRQRALLVVLAAVVAAGAWRHRALLATTRARAIVGGVVALSAAALVLPLVLEGRLTTPMLADRLVHLLAGWSLFAWLPLAERDGAGGATPNDASAAPVLVPRLGIGALLAVAVAAYAAANHWVSRGYPILQDEVLYVLQASWMREPGFGWALSPELLRFFRVEYTSVLDGRMHTQYPPGWPALIALFGAVGLARWSAVALSAAAVGLTYLLGRRAHSRQAGLAAAALLAVQPWVVESAAGYMSHAASTAMSAAAAWLLLEGEARAGRPRIACWLVAGLALALLLATRPLTAVAVGASMVLWLLARGNLRAGEVAAMVAAMAAGALPAVGGLLGYNAVTNGSPLLFGYTRVHGALHDLGFGRRGFMLYRGADAPSPGLVIDFTPALALQRFGDRLSELAEHAIPLLLVFTVLALGLLFRFPFRWRSVAAWLPLPAAYVFYFFSNIRFYSELLPVLLVGAAMVLAHVARRNLAAARAVLAAGVLAGVVVSGVWAERFERQRARPIADALARLERHADGGAKVLAFVADDDAEAYWFRRLAVLNAGGLDGRVLVARDRGAENAQLARRFPGRTVLRVEWPKGAELATIVPWAPRAP